MNKYKPIGKIGEGTFSDVLKTLSLRDGKYYACKHMKQHFESMEQVNKLREVQALRRLSPHPNILMLHEVVFDKKAGSLSLICELMDMNIYELIKGRRKPLPEKKIKNYMYQLCKSLDYIHRNGIFHRDVKPENILIKQNTLKLGDFGSCRSIYSKQPHTEYISTRWYRAPECLLTNGYYSYKIDLWSAGCVFYEITSFQPLFPGSNELDQISKIHDVIGTPTNKTLNKLKQSRIASFDFPFKKGKGIPPLVHNLSSKGFSLLYAMIKYDPDERIAAHQALQHPYFQELWAADTQALATHKKFRLLGNTAGQVPLHLWQISKESQRQFFLRKVQEKTKQHAAPRGELAKLNLSEVAKLTSCPTPTLHSVFRAPKESGETPVLPPVRFIGSDTKSTLESTYLLDLITSTSSFIENVQITQSYEVLDFDAVSVTAEYFYENRKTFFIKSCIYSRTPSSFQIAKSESVYGCYCWIFHNSQDKYAGLWDYKIHTPQSCPSARVPLYDVFRAKPLRRRTEQRYCTFLTEIQLYWI